MLVTANSEQLDRRAIFRRYWHGAVHEREALFVEHSPDGARS